MSDFIATFNFVEISNHDDASRRATARENSTRPAVVEVTHISSGTGQSRISAPLVFPVIFRTEPHFTSGSAVITNPDATTWNDPRGSCGVYAWKIDGRGFFTGAHIWVRVDMDTIDTTITVPALIRQPVVEHHLTFSAQAIKDLPTNTLSADLPPRTTGV